MYSTTKTRRASRKGRAITSITAATVTVLATLIAAPAANAAETPAPPTATTAEISAEEQSNLEALLAASDNTGDVPVFDVDRALQLGADEAATEEFADAFVQSGGTVSGDTAARSLQSADRTTADIQARAADCRGRTGYTGIYWFGPQTALDSCLTTTLINGIGIAAAGGGVYTAASALTVAGLPSSAVVGVVSAVLALGVGFLNICKDTSSLNAIYLNGGVPGVVVPSCWAQ